MNGSVILASGEQDSKRITGNNLHEDDYDLLSTSTHRTSTVLSVKVTEKRVWLHGIFHP